MIGAPTQDCRTIPRLWSVDKGTRVLDLGCGMGLYTAELARLGACPVGLDLSAQNLVQAKKQTAGQRISWVRGDAAHLPFREGVFELVVSVEVLTHLPPGVRRGIWSELERVLCQGGRALLTLHNRARLSVSRWLRLERPREWYGTANLDVWPTTPQEARQSVSACGLELGGRVRYLNYHSRFTSRWAAAHPHLAAVVVLVEEVLARTPLLRCLGITFLICPHKGRRE